MEFATGQIPNGQRAGRDATLIHVSIFEGTACHTYSASPWPFHWLT
jgi:hypothetical protein